jgi:hypothetical protein
MPSFLRSILLMPWFVAWLAPGLTHAGEDENWQRLRSMPREQRLILAENLKRFDNLDPQQKAVLRKLDEEIAKLPTENRANYESVLRRYHLWLQSLRKEQQDQLNAAAPDQRMALVRKFLAEERSTPKTSPSSFLQLADLTAQSPYDLAHKIKIWLEMSPAERTEAEHLPPEKRKPRIEELAKKKKIGMLRRITKAEEEKLLKQLEGNSQMKNQLNRLTENKKVAELKRIADNYHFIENPPEKVSAENLMRFDAALPSWIRQPLDHLPPEEARRRLTILYRLVFPAGSEMPAAVKPAASAEEPAAPVQTKAPAKVPKPTGASSPY